MKKAYIVYKAHEEIGITAALRKATLLLAFGVCFFGFQSETVAQTVYSFSQTSQTGTATPVASADASFLKDITFSKNNEDVVQILREEKREVLNSRPTDGEEEVEANARIAFLDRTAIAISRDQVAVTEAFVDGLQFIVTKFGVSQFSTGIDFEGIVEEYARLVD